MIDVDLHQKALWANYSDDVDLRPKVVNVLTLQKKQNNRVLL